MMITRKQAGCVLAAFVAFAAAVPSHAAYDVSDTGLWPTNWPRELEPLRRQSRTLRHDQYKMYEIPFTNQQHFEAAWAHVLAVKSPEAPIILLKGPNERLGKTIKAGVRILAPLTGELITPKGGHYPPSAEGIVTNIALLKIGPPWSDDLKSKSGALPEFVVYDNGRWAAYSVTNRRTDSPIRERFIMRARTDVELIVDGDIVDLNRISLPPNTPVVDKRFDHGATGAIGSPPKDLVEAKVTGPELAGTVRIQLVDSEGKAVAFAQGGAAHVFIQDAMTTGVGSWGGTVAVSKAGAGEFKGVPPGKYLVSSHLVAAPEGPTINPQQAILVEVTVGQLTEGRVVYRSK